MGGTSDASEGSNVSRASPGTRLYPYVPLSHSSQPLRPSLPDFGFRRPPPRDFERMSWGPPHAFPPREHPSSWNSTSSLRPPPSASFNYPPPSSQHSRPPSSAYLSVSVASSPAMSRGTIAFPSSPVQTNLSDPPPSGWGRGSHTPNPMFHSNNTRLEHGKDLGNSQSTPTQRQWRGKGRFQEYQQFAD
ncbi:hypothetical protein DB88DRAFT_496200 [Papiliotrema laurentii]|uniref:Uncharacterized protein n=1 Tax=Papiliotrema laurentii TaxID=5418 RepID=A0AAD9CY67_PAPLA|nr:hypothetical protein DB88DRAFT_496200 [Papiliotrema laurentii]